jgi:Protein of unknown function (DUF2961)
VIDPALDCRAVTFENPSGRRGRGGMAANGRKGAPSRLIMPGEKVTLAELDGPGTVRHIWMTVMPMPPEALRAVWMEVFYDGNALPSVSVPVLDFFGMPHGRPVAFDSAVIACHEGLGLNSYLPMPFLAHMRMELTNSSPRPVIIYYQVDYTLESSLDEEVGYLHVSFRRENPTRLREDFTIARDFKGPGRFLGCNVGIRVIDEGDWYGEGELKVYRDGDGEWPTICGTGLEDYVGSAWGMGRHSGWYAGSPLMVCPPAENGGESDRPTFVGFYRWHLADPIMFAESVTVTLQQIGSVRFLAGEEERMESYERTNPAAGTGYLRNLWPGVLAWGLAERVDDYCATAYVYLMTPQVVPALDIAGAVADVARLPYEQPHRMESMVSGST